VNEPLQIIPGAEPFRFEGGTTGALLVHGFSGSPASMLPIGRLLADAGLSVMGVRLPGHGTSEHQLASTRWPEWFGEVERSFDDLRERCRTLVVVAQSFGGALAVHLAAARPGDADGIVLLNPYLRDRRLALIPFVRPFLRWWRGIGSDIKRGGDEIAYDRIPVPALASAARMLRMAHRDLPAVTTPMLVFGSAEDHVIPRGNPELAVSRAGSARKELVRCPNSYHLISMDNDVDMVAGRVLAFIRSLEAPEG